MGSIILSYSLSLPQSTYPHLDDLISINKRVIKSWISDLWNNETLNKLKQTGKALSILKKEVQNQEKRIPSIANDTRTTKSKKHREKLLYQEQKRRQMKIKQTRKEILSVLTNWVIECKVIAIERLRFKETPNWQSSKAVKGFTEGFYRKTRDKLQHRAKLRGIRVLEVEPAYTSQYWHKCNKKAETDKLTIKCECGRHDRDYNAGVKIIKESIAQIRQGLASFTCLLVEISALKLKRLQVWMDTRSYGCG